MHLPRPLIPLLTVSVIVLLFSLVVTTAQDTVKLKDGSVVRGDIVSVDATGVELVTADATLITVPGDQVEDIKRGVAFTPAVKLKLVDIDQRDPDAVYEVAAWAYHSRGRRKDGKRLLRRVIAMKPDHAEAREMLGHVHALGRWYPDRRSAYVATRERMKADGYVFHKKGWIKEELHPYLKKSPGDWVLWRGFLWRSKSEVRKERGDKLWKKEWYVGQEARLVKTLKRIEKLTGDDCHAARVGTSRVFCYLGREEAQAAAERQQKARDWFIETFEVATRRKSLVKHPLKEDWVLSGEAAFKRWLDHRRRAGGISPAQYQLSLRTQNTSSGFFMVNHMGREAWKWSLVSHMGLAMMYRYWVGGHVPAWMKVASGHHAEIEVFGDARVQWVHVGAYDQGVKIPELKGHSLKEIKAAVRSFYKGNTMPSLRSMMSKDMNELTQELDTLGTVYLLYLLEEHKGALLDFLTRPVKGANNVRERFEGRFKMTFEEMDGLFRTWIGL